MQFSLKGLMGLVLACSVLCGILFAAPAFISIPLLAATAFLLPALFIALLVYSRHSGRAFALGCLAVGTPFLLYFNYAALVVAFDGDSISELFSSSSETLMYKFYLAVYLAGICVPGLISMGVRRWVMGRPAANPALRAAVGNNSASWVLQGRASVQRTPGDSSAPIRKHTWRFWTFVGATVVCASAGLLLDWALLGGLLSLATILLVALLSPAPALSMLVYSRGAARAFAIGFLSIWWCPATVAGGWMFTIGFIFDGDGNMWGTAGALAAILGVALLGGGIGVVTRRLATRANATAPNDSLFSSPLRSFDLEAAHYESDQRQVLLFSEP